MCYDWFPLSSAHVHVNSSVCFFFSHYFQKFLSLGTQLIYILLICHSVNKKINAAKWFSCNSIPYLHIYPFVRSTIRETTEDGCISRLRLRKLYSHLNTQLDLHYEGKQIPPIFSSSLVMWAVDNIAA